MKIESERLIIRDHLQSDFDSIHEYAKDLDFSKYEAWGPNTPEDTQNYIDECLKKSKQTPRVDFDLAVTIKDSGEQIGGVGIRIQDLSSKVSDIGWAINTRFQGKGYATEAARSMMNFGFTEQGLEMIYATCDTRNIASYKVMEKLGMRRVSETKNDRTIRGVLRDSYRYEITKKEFYEN